MMIISTKSSTVSRSKKTLSLPLHSALPLLWDLVAPQADVWLGDCFLPSLIESRIQQVIDTKAKPQ
jgi:hypothetical protein